jgi:hypothetical protein
LLLALPDFAAFDSPLQSFRFNFWIPLLLQGSNTSPHLGHVTFLLVFLFLLFWATWGCLGGMMWEAKMTEELKHRRKF